VNPAVQEAGLPAVRMKLCIFFPRSKIQMCIKRMKRLAARRAG
jgi:hypothetical protein